MEVHDDHVPEATFATCLEHLPQVCVEVVVETDGGVLLARRTNEPARGEWFWPGGRLYKGEDLESAARRVAREELGLAVAVRELLGARSHFWDRTAVEGLEDRHTVNLVYRVAPTEKDPTVALDDQHDAHRVLREPEPGLHEHVREYVAAFDLL